MEIVNTLWVEKYRPKEIKDLVLPDEYRKEFEKFIERRDIPGLLLAGPPGSGKSTLARILTSKYGIMNNPNDNLLEINGSAKETRGISFVQDVIEPFLKVPPIIDKYKIVFIDEGDYLTDASFNSLRNVIEKYSKYCRFIFTCNYISKIPEPIQSRLETYMFKQFPIEFVVNYGKNILDKESVKYSEVDLKYICESLYPDVRKVTNSLQRCSMSGELKVNKDVVLSNEKVLLSNVVEIINFTVKKENSKIGKILTSVVEILNEQDLDFRNIYQALFFMKEIPIPAKIVVNKFSISHNDCLIPSMHFMAMIFEIIKSLQEYQNGIKK
jgi:DNA polymerase III delta prime subunit